MSSDKGVEHYLSLYGIEYTSMTLPKSNHALNGRNNVQDRVWIFLGKDQEGFHGKQVCDRKKFFGGHDRPFDSLNLRAEVRRYHFNTWDSTCDLRQPESSLARTSHFDVAAVLAVQLV